MTDLISRKAAIDEVMALPNTENGYSDTYDKECIIGLLKEMPTAEKRGKWIKISPANIYECSVCHQNVMTKDIEEYHFCHHCGADMRGEE